MARIVNENRSFAVIPRNLIFDANLSIGARFVYVFISATNNNEGFFLEPMARELGYSVDTLYKYINELAAKGWIVGTFRANQHEFVFSKTDVER